MIKLWLFTIYLGNALKSIQSSDELADILRLLTMFFVGVNGVWFIF